MATGNTHTKFGEDCLCNFQVMRADEQTNRHTHHSTSHDFSGQTKREQWGQCASCLRHM